MKATERHFRSVSAMHIEKHFDELERGYRIGAGLHAQPDIARRFFHGKRYCLEDYQEMKYQTSENAAFCIGYLVGRQERPDQG